MRTGALLVALGLSAAVALVALAAPAPAIAPYRLAASRHEAGEVGVRAYFERQTVNGPDLPLKDVVVALVPFSDSLVAEAERVKDHARDSLSAYRAAALEIRRIEEAYEKAVWEAGAPDLVLSSLVGADGRISFTEVAAGPWLLWARREVWAPVSEKKLKGQGKEPFLPGTRLVGFWTASYWMVPVTVGTGTVASIELTDRNVWFSGVIEERVRQDTVR